jgi:hypothetical protein
VKALSLAPSTLLDDRGTPRFGVYRGELDRVDLRPLGGPLRRLLRGKRWHWAMVATDRVAVCFTIVDVGYAASGFAVAVDLASRRLVVDVGALGLPGVSARVDGRWGSDGRSRFRGGGVHLSLDRRGTAVGLGIRSSELRLTARLDTTATDPITVVAPVVGGTVNVTRKATSLPASGWVEAGGRRYDLEGGFGGMDHTVGLLGRRTAWRWAFAMGRTEDGRTVGFNLAEGFNEWPGGSENALWLGDQLASVGSARFTFDPTAILTPWQVVTEDGRIALAFNPVGQHREERNFVVTRSRLAQLLGTFSGTVDAGDGPVRIDSVPGVTEDQDVVW